MLGDAQVLQTQTAGKLYDLRMVGTRRSGEGAGPFLSHPGPL